MLPQPAHHAGLRCLSYTINDQKQAQRLLELGVDAIITDRLDLFVPQDQSILSAASRRKLATDSWRRPEPTPHRTPFSHPSPSTTGWSLVPGNRQEKQQQLVPGKPLVWDFLKARISLLLATTAPESGRATGTTTNESNCLKSSCWA